MNTLLQTLLEEFYDRIKNFPAGTIRKIKVPDVIDKIIVMIGMRRGGKTHFLFQIMHHLFCLICI